MAEKKTAERTKNSRNGGKAGAGKNLNTKKKSGGKAYTAEEERAADYFYVRIVAGFLMFFLALFLVLGMLGVNGLFLNLINGLIRGLLGYACWLMPVVFVYIGWMLIFRHREPALIRIASLMLTMIFFSGLMHALLCHESFGSENPLLQGLWTSGKTCSSGGLIPGLIAALLMKLVSRVGAVAVLLALTLLLVIITFRINIPLLVHKKAQKVRNKNPEAGIKAAEEAARSLTRDDLRADLDVIANEVVDIMRPDSLADRLQLRPRERDDSEEFDFPEDDAAVRARRAVFVMPDTGDGSAADGKKKKQARQGRGGYPFFPDATENAVPARVQTPKEPFGAQTDDVLDLVGGNRRPADADRSRARNSRAQRKAFDIPLGTPEPTTPAQPRGTKAPVQPEKKEKKASVAAARFSPEAPLSEEQPALFADTLFTPEAPAEKAPDFHVPEAPAPLYTGQKKEPENPQPGRIPLSGEASRKLTEDDIDEGAREAKKSGQMSEEERDENEAAVAREIESGEDAAAEKEKVYQIPPVEMLTAPTQNADGNTDEVRQCERLLNETLNSFGVDTQISYIVQGPTVTRYELRLKPGVKMSKITNLHEDIALTLGVSGVRVAAVEGKSSVIGIEVPNRKTTSVPIREVLESAAFKNHKSPLAFTVGKDISGDYIVGDISKMPHLLIAGTTGSGKSVCMNSIIVSLLYRAAPSDCRMIMIDPKVVELSVYNGIPHLLIPVVTDAKKAAGSLQWAVTEMERRYRDLAEYNVRDRSGYIKLAATNPEMRPMPNIVIIIDELADLMMVAAKDVENSIVRIAQKARAAGMYLIIATQRPSADVVTGLIKANVPSRIAFAVSSAINSRIILDDSGAEKLVGKGDMLYAPLGTGKPRRIQGCFITDEEVEDIVHFIKESGEAEYSDEIISQIDQNARAAEQVEQAGAGGNPDALDDEGDEQLPDAVEVVLEAKMASVSMLQRRLKLGYAHAARIMDEMEEKGIVGPFEGSKPRQLLITKAQWDTMVGINPRAHAPEEDAEPPAVSPDEEEDPPF